MPPSVYWSRSFAVAPRAFPAWRRSSRCLRPAPFSAIAFAASGRYEAAPLAELIAPLVLFLPGALLTMATVDLASDEVVTGASRFLAGLMQTRAIGVRHRSRREADRRRDGNRPSSPPKELLGPWAPWVGILMFAVGTSLQHSAPRRSLPWLLLVLYAAWCGQLLGQALFGAGLSGFVGGLVVAPLAMIIERFPSAPGASELSTCVLAARPRCTRSDRLHSSWSATNPPQE